MCKLLTFVRTLFKKLIAASGGKYMPMTIKQLASERQLNTRLKATYTLLFITRDVILLQQNNGEQACLANC